MSAHALSPQEKVRIYFRIFFALFVITICEVAATFLPGPKIFRDIPIVLMACTKAGLVGYYYMHLNHEKKWLRIVAVLPIFMLVYTAVLIPDTIRDRPTATYFPIRPRVFPVMHHEEAEAGHGGESHAVSHDTSEDWQESPAAMKARAAEHPVEVAAPAPVAPAPSAHEEPAPESASGSESGAGSEWK